MIRGFNTALLALMMGSWAPGAAHAQLSGSVQGIGGVTFGGGRGDVLIGAGVGVNLTPDIQAIGEVVYMRNARSDLFGLADAVLRAAGVDVRLSTLYGDGGVRFLTPRAPVRGYVETTAGVARLRLGADVRSDRDGVDPVLDDVLRRFNTTQPLLGVGGGVLLDAGPARVDIGYRFKRIYTDAPLDVNQFRTAVGFSF